MKQHTYWQMDYDEFNALIREHFHKPDYDVVAEEEWANDSEHTMPIRLDMYSNYDRADVQFFMENAPPWKGWHCSWGNLLTELAERKVIPEGDYLIAVCW